MLIIKTELLTGIYIYNTAKSLQSKVTYYAEKEDEKMTTKTLEILNNCVL